MPHSSELTTQKTEGKAGKNATNMLKNNRKISQSSKNLLKNSFIVHISKHYLQGFWLDHAVVRNFPHLLLAAWRTNELHCMALATDFWLIRMACFW